MSVECVVLLHGLARSARSMAPLAAAFRAAGYVVHNIDYPSRRHTIETLAENALGEALTRCAAHAPSTIHFVTHSLGGILVRQYLARHELPRIGRVVMLAPPNQGSEVVDRFGRVPGFRRFNGPAIEQLGTGAASLPRRLGAVQVPVGVIAGTRSINWLLSTALPGPNDGKVTVASTRVEGMHDFLILPVSHPFIMRDPRAVAAAVNFVRHGRFADTTP